jgi:hypothetical protein
MKASRSFETSQYTGPPTQLDISQVLILSENLSRNFDIMLAQKTVKKYEFENLSSKYIVGASID